MIIVKLIVFDYEYRGDLFGARISTDMSLIRDIPSFSLVPKIL